MDSRPIKFNKSGKYNLDFIDWNNEWERVGEVACKIENGEELSDKEEEAMMDKIHKKSKPKAEKNDEKSKVSAENTSEDGKSMMNSLRSHKLLKSKKNLISGMNSSRELSIKTEAIKSEDDKKIRKIKSNPNNNKKKKNIDIHPENNTSEKESINQ